MAKKEKNTNEKGNNTIYILTLVLLAAAIICILAVLYLSSSGSL